MKELDITKITSTFGTCPDIFVKFEILPKVSIGDFKFKSPPFARKPQPIVKPQQTSELESPRNDTLPAVSRKK